MVYSETKKRLMVCLHDHRVNLKRLKHKLNNLSFADIDNYSGILDAIIYTSNQIGKLENTLNIEVIDETIKGY